jgi:hypothetical protein
MGMGKRRLPVQWALMGLVLLTALASALYSRLKSRPNSESAEAINAVSVMPPSPSPPVEEGVTPATPVEAAMEAAKRGDLDAYLAQFADPLKAQLTKTRAEKGDAYLRDYLKRLTTPIKGIAADLNRMETVRPDTVNLPVQFLYADHNETQTFQLRQQGAEWRICQIASARAAPTLIPYGTPIDQIK